jgi:O-antigen polymerase
VSRFIVQALIFLLPFFFWPSPVKFELAKIFLFFSAGFFLVIYLLTNFNLKTFERYFKNLDKIWFLWVGILFLSTLINQSFPDGFLLGGYRHQSVLFFFILGLFVLIIKEQKTESLRQILKWASLAIILETLIIFGQWLAIKFNFPILSYNQRPIGTIGEPNAVAGFLVLGLPILVTSFSQPLIPFLAVILAVLLTGSKAGILAILAELIISVFLWKKEIPYKKLILATALILIVLLGILGVYLEKGESHFENRWLIWNLGIKAVQEKPILGYGAEGIIAVYDKEFKQIDLTLEGLAIDRSHNLFLDIALFSGLMGLTVFYLWLWRVSQKLIKKKSWVLASLIGFLVFSFFQPIGVTHWFYLIFLISLTNT